jgi:phage shock protein PspC (stress-responsive transcriptional regulator)
MAGTAPVRHLGPMTKNASLTRSSHDSKIAGVAGGLGEYFGVDPVLFRVGFGVSVLFSGAGLVAYLVLALIMPSDRVGTPAAA